MATPVQTLLLPPSALLLQGLVFISPGVLGMSALEVEGRTLSVTGVCTYTVYCICLLHFSCEPRCLSYMLNAIP